MLRRVGHLLEMRQMEQNRLDTAAPSWQARPGPSLNRSTANWRRHGNASEHIDNDPDLKRRGGLLESISGVGEATAAHLRVALSEH
jgi:transposase